MSPTIDDLPDLCLLSVFQYLSILELFCTIRLVNTRWSRLINAELNRRRSLIIVDDRHFDLSRLQLDQYGSHLIEHVKRDDDALTPWARLTHIDHRNVLNRNDWYPHNDDENRYFHVHTPVPPEMITTLMNSLLRITKLTVVLKFVDLSELDQVIRMINHWSDSLVTLKVSLMQEFVPWLVNAIPNNYGEQMNAQTVKLFASINRVASLKHLKLEVHFVRKEQFTNLPPLTILSQLSSFDSGHLFKAHLDHTLRINASGNGQLQITTSIEHKLDLLLRVNREFRDKFVDVEIKDTLKVSQDDNGHLIRILRDLNHFCTQFTALSHLLLNIGNISVKMLSRPLSHLTQLVHLTLCVFDHREINDENPEYQNLVPVPSVRLMTLKLYINSHNSTERLHIPEIFPNLQVLSITDFNNIRQCTVCQLQTVERYDEYAPKQRQCAQLARQPFRRCLNLHTIEIDANDSHFLSLGMSTRLITRDEL